MKLTTLTILNATGNSSTNNHNEKVIHELERQLDYDEFMNDVWIGVVLTLIIISCIFCLCSCFLYHQFRTWKANYHNIVAQSSTCADSAMESTKFHIIASNDPLPDYTAVSGLPTYESALELQKAAAAMRLTSSTTDIKSNIQIIYSNMFNCLDGDAKNTNHNAKPDTQVQYTFCAREEEK